MKKQSFGKNLRYLRQKRGMSGEMFLRSVNKFLRRELQLPDDQLLNRKRLGSYEEGRAFPPAYVLPFFLKVLKHKDAVTIFTVNLEEESKKQATTSPTNKIV